jgi:hypothetical protein
MNKETLDIINKYSLSVMTIAEGTLAPVMNIKFSETYSISVKFTRDIIADDDLLSDLLKKEVRTYERLIRNKKLDRL